MTKKDMRRKIMESADYPDKWVDYIDSCEEKFTYKREGELLKEELKEVISHLEGWNGSLDNTIKGTWRRKLREIVGIDYGSELPEGYGKFSEYELSEIWREVASSCEYQSLYDSVEGEYYCPVCDKQ